ncbi:MAG: hypothetical protein PUE73_03210 [Eubacteriales bacterium]|nr:hypothetical protein [Eubacteriales bacterium]
MSKKVDTQSTKKDALPGERLFLILNYLLASSTATAQATVAQLLRESR